jgi:hypothetical protein
MVDMNTLKENKIPLSWGLGIVGIINNYISPEDLLRDIDPNELNIIDNTKLLELYSLEENSKEKFIEILTKYFNFSDELLSNYKLVWSIAFLNNVLNSNISVSEKLKKISNLWAMFDYPENWKHFIYYMPVENDIDTSEELVYEKFITFLHQQNKRISEFINNNKNNIS